MTGTSRTVVSGGAYAAPAAYTAGSIRGAYAAVPTAYTSGSIGMMQTTGAPRAATFATQGGYMPTTTMPTLGSINTQMAVPQAIGSIGMQMPAQSRPVQMGVVQPQFTTMAGGYTAGYAPINQAQMAYNQQMQVLQQAISLEAQIEKQLDALKPNKDALAKRAKQRDLENKRFELQKLEREVMGLKPDPQVVRQHARQAFANKAQDEQEKIAVAQHMVEEQKIDALKAQLAVFKFDAGQIDADGKEIKVEKEDKKDDAKDDKKEKDVAKEAKKK